MNDLERLLSELSVKNSCISEMQREISNLRKELDGTAKERYIECLRDDFAGKAMQGMMDSKCTHPDDLDFISIRSYEMADRMMKARNSK